MRDLDKSKKELVEELGDARQRLKFLEESRVLLRDDPRYTQAANALLRLFAGATNRKDYLRLALRFLHVWSDCRYVGVRVLHENGDIPYEAYMGFSREFWESENWLSIYQDQCVCIRVVTGQPDPQDLAYLTPGGSFFLDDSLSFVQGLPEEHLPRYRGMCMKCGFRTVVVVPIASQGRVLGVIHLADEEGGKLSRQDVAFLESVAYALGQAIPVLLGQGGDKALGAYFRLLMETSQDCVCLFDLQGAVQAMNTAGCLLHHLEEPQAMVGQRLVDHIVQTRDEVAEALSRAAAGEEAALQYQTRDRHGHQMWWDSRFTPVKRLDGSVSGILHIGRDVTLRRRN